MNWYIAKGIRVTEKALLEQYPSGIPPFVDEVILRADHDAALRRAKAEVWREAATHVLTCMHAVDAANDFDARAAQIEKGVQ